MGDPTTPGWYVDPAEPERERYWDGDEWREGGRPAGGVRGPHPTAALTAETLARRTYLLAWSTLAVALLAAILAFMAVRTAAAARDAAMTARFSGYAGSEVQHLEDQLREAGVLPPLEG